MLPARILILSVVSGLVIGRFSHWSVALHWGRLGWTYLPHLVAHLAAHFTARLVDYLSYSATNFLSREKLFIGISRAWCKTIVTTYFIKQVTLVLHQALWFDLLTECFCSTLFTECLCSTKKSDEVYFILII